MTEQISGTPGATTRDTDVAIVEKFLYALRDKDLDLAGALLDEHVVYQNAGLSTVRGRRRVMKLFSGMQRPAFGFDVKFHQNLAAEDGTVINERTDVLIFGPVRIVLWVWGKFEVRDGRITLWRDYIDVFDFVKGILRGLAGAAIPSLQREF